MPLYAGCGGQTVPVANATYEQEVIRLVNQERANAGLPPLKQVSSLSAAGRYHAADMSQDNYFSHDTLDRRGGSLVSVCAWSARIGAYYSSWSSLAENIAAGYATPQAVMNGWMNSAGHRANILGSSVWEIGVGFYQGGGDYGRYWVQDFGRRSGVYPLVINREAAATSSTAVSLYIYGSWSRVRLRTGNGPWSQPMPFSNTMAWNLAQAPGEQTVFAELSGAGTTLVVSDAITYTGLPTPSAPNAAFLPAVLKGP